MITSYAQNFEDVMLWRALKHIERGFYIDIGAQDPRIDSVSLLFYEQGWRGMHVEPTPYYAEALRRERPDETVLQAAVGRESTTLQFYEIPGTGISTADEKIVEQHRARGFQDREIVVPCVTLASVFEAAGDRDVHWLKVDVEGFERQVLDSWGESAARPWIVVVESTLPLTQIDCHDEWESVLDRRGYSAVYFDGLNRYYVADEHQELKQAFAAPPNVFDDFALGGEASAPFHRQIVERDNAELEATRKELRQRDEDSKARIRALLREIESLNQRDTEGQLAARDELLALERKLREQECLWGERDREQADELSKIRTEFATTLKHLAAVEEAARGQMLELLMRVDATHESQVRSQAEREQAWQRTLGERERYWGGMLQASRDEVHALSDAALQRERYWTETLQSTLAEIGALTEAGRQGAKQAEQALERQVRSLREAAEVERIRLSEDFATELAALRRSHQDERDRCRAREAELIRQCEAVAISASEERQKLTEQHAAALEEKSREWSRQAEREHNSIVQGYETLIRESEIQRTAFEQRVAEDSAFLQSQIEQCNKEREKNLSDYSAEVAVLNERVFLMAERSAAYLWEGYRLGRSERARGWFARAFSLGAPDVGIDLQRLSQPVDSMRAAGLAERGVNYMRKLKINFQPEFVLRSDGKYGLEDFLSLHDRSFVRAAYLAILKREPDEYGERHYLSRVRSGVSKAIILSDIQNSKEARRHNVRIAHLKGAILANKLFGVPVLGNLIQGVCFFFSVNRHLRDLRALENHLVRMGEEMQKNCQDQMEFSEKYQATSNRK
ncbi:FkbM family methyltransferase [Burkholderia cenocepacia]|uniref:FkbM family methyltransferase n=1 Tax=Burkholderia cenocepacia TaxID=95486 RepID=UPI001B9B017E|nr:FkbM family methyltransferase [Burkholderia cenocepacia]MBR8157938.1 FkbM family methyltransferase [Burkholderia cenocepacia]